MLRLSKSLVEICYEIVDLFDANRHSDERFGDSHGRSAFSTDLVENRVCNGEGQRSRIAKMARADDYLQAIEKLETIHAKYEFEGQQSTGASKELCCQSVLRMARESGVVDAGDHGQLLRSPSLQQPNTLLQATA